MFVQYRDQWLTLDSVLPSSLNCIGVSKSPRIFALVVFGMYMFLHGVNLNMGRGWACFYIASLRFMQSPSLEQLSSTGIAARTVCTSLMTLGEVLRVANDICELLILEDLSALSRINAHMADTYTPEHTPPASGQQLWE